MEESLITRPGEGNPVWPIAIGGVLARAECLCSSGGSHGQPGEMLQVADLQRLPPGLPAGASGGRLSPDPSHVHAEAELAPLAQPPESMN